VRCRAHCLGKAAALCWRLWTREGNTWRRAWCYKTIGLTCSEHSQVEKHTLRLYETHAYSLTFVTFHCQSNGGYLPGSPSNQQERAVGRCNSGLERCAILLDLPRGPRVTQTASWMLADASHLHSDQLLGHKPKLGDHVVTRAKRCGCMSREIASVSPDAKGPVVKADLVRWYAVLEVKASDEENPGPHHNSTRRNEGQIWSASLATTSKNARLPA
jgi:hypothetical protein